MGLNLAVVLTSILLVVGIALIGHVMVRRRARSLAARGQIDDRGMRVNPYDGTVEPRRQSAGPVHDPSPSGIFDRSGTARRE